MGYAGWNHVDDQPYFFLSYAHTPRHDAGEQTDPDYWVEELFRDLSRHMREMLGLSAEVDPGFMDRELRPGNEWPGALARALATCRVFIPLYSRRYFASVHCGKEWSAFARRIDRYQQRSGERERFIVPALWVPLRGPVPAEVAGYGPGDFGDAYADLGFYGIMKLTRYRDEYDAAVVRLARQIVEAGRETAEWKPLPPGPVEKYEQLENAFGAAHPTGDGERRVLVTVAALDASSRTHGGSAAQYGETASEWTPYPEESTRPLAEEAADLATSLGYLPEVGGLAEHEHELLSPMPPTRAMVLIVDPWAARVQELLDILRKIDSSDKPWISVVVAWNPKDSKMVTDERDLRAALAAALPNKLVEGRVTSALAVRGVPTLAEFGMVVPAVLRAAERSFLRFASASPAHDPAVK
jgi:FxsC-like protein